MDADIVGWACNIWMLKYIYDFIVIAWDKYIYERLIRVICWTVHWGSSDWSCTIDYYRLLLSAHVWEVPGVLNLDLSKTCSSFATSSASLLSLCLLQCSTHRWLMSTKNFTESNSHQWYVTTHAVYAVFAWPRQPVWLKCSFYTCLSLSFMLKP